MRKVLFFLIICYMMTFEGMTQQLWTTIIKVKPKPELVSIVKLSSTANSGVCSGDTITFTFKAYKDDNNPVTTIELQGTFTNWTAAGIPNQFSTSSTGNAHLIENSTDSTMLITTYTAIITVSNNYSADINVLGEITGLITNSCTASGLNNIFSLVVHPTPTVTRLNSTICSGNKWGSSFTSAYSNATFDYSSKITSGTLSTPPVMPSGSGVTAVAGIEETTWSNGGTSDAIVVFTITPYEHGCVGDTVHSTLIVRAPLTVSASPATQQICSGSSMNKVTYNVTSPANTTPVSYEWIASNTGAIVSGHSTIPKTDTIEKAILSVAGTNNGIVTYSITATANGCTANFTHVVTVKPVPVVTVTPSSQTICSGQAITPPSVSHNVTESSLVESWNWSFSQLGTQISGATTSGNSEILPADTLLNNDNTTVHTAAYIFNVTVNGCTSAASQTFAIAVNPQAIITFLPTSSDTICSGEATAFSMSSSVPGTYSWTATPEAGIAGTASSGTGTFNNNIASIWNNSTSTTKYVTFSVIAQTIESCISTQYYTVFVRPLPTVTIFPLELCKEDAITIVLNGSKAPFLLDYKLRNKDSGESLQLPSAYGLQTSFTGTQSGTAPDFTYTTGLNPGSLGTYEFILKSITDGNGCVNKNSVITW